MKTIKNADTPTMSTTTNKQDFGNEIITRKNVKETPFTIISLNDKNQHFASLGEYRITEIYDSAGQVQKEVEKITWNRLIQVMMILNEQMKINNIKIKK